MRPDPTIRGLLYRLDLADQLAADLIAWAACELNSAYADTPARDLGVALRLAGRIVRRNLDAIRRYRRQLPHGVAAWRPGDEGESWADCLPDSEG